MLILMRCADGTIGPELIEVKPFTFYLGGVPYQFGIYERSEGNSSVTHLESGSAVAHIPYSRVTPEDGAKALERLIFRHGVDRIRKRIDAAEKINAIG